MPVLQGWHETRLGKQMSYQKLVRWKCDRCSVTAEKTQESEQFMHDQMPNTWRENGQQHFCQACSLAFNKFMKEAQS